MLCGALAAAMIACGARASAEGFSLFAPAPARPASTGELDTRGGLVDLEHSYPWGAGAADEERWFERGIGDLPAAAEADPASAPARRCVIFQCVSGTRPPPAKVFTTPVALWTASAELIGIINAAQAPLRYGAQSFHFTDEGFFQTWTYSGGADKASHFTVSANVAGLLYDAYRLNGLSKDQSFGLSLASTVLAGVIVEIGDGISPYGFSAQDLTADTLGSLAAVVVKRYGLDDLIWFSLGKVATTVPISDGTASLGSDYSNEMYDLNLQLAGLAPRFHAKPGIERFFLFSFAYFTKGYGYDPPLPGRYQEIGLEIGLNFEEILKAVGVSDSTWWGDTLLRAVRFFRIPYTQIGAYYNLTNGKWYGPGAPYHYQPGL